MSTFTLSNPCEPGQSGPRKNISQESAKRHLKLAMAKIGKRLHERRVELIDDARRWDEDEKEIAIGRIHELEHIEQFLDYEFKTFKIVREHNLSDVDRVIERLGKGKVRSVEQVLEKEMRR